MEGDDDRKGNILDLAAERLKAEQAKTKNPKAKRKSQPGDAKEGEDPATRLPEGRHATLEIRPGESPELADEAERILIERDGIFQRSGYLARLAVAKPETVHGIQRRDGNITIVPLDVDYLNDRLNRLIAWRKYSFRMGRTVTCNAPRPVASTLLSRSGAWNFKQLTGVITAPTLRPDGSLIERPGYDEATGLLFHADQAFPPTPQTPSREDGRAALDYLVDEVLSGFDFAAAHDQAAALSALLTAAVRPSLRTAPLHAFSAPRPASGKSLLADCVALIVTGRPATNMSFTPDPDESRKRILTVLMGGDQVINLDNIEGALEGDALCSVLTNESYTDRLLGTQRQGTAPTCVTWLATGNNLTVAGDMTRRVILCNLDPKTDRPEERVFSRDLYRWIPANRPALIVAALTALRAYIAAGRPPQALRTLGSFEGWSGLIRASLVWLGEADPLLSRSSIENADPVRRKLRSLLLGWYSTFKAVPATSNELITLANLTERNEGGDEIRRHPELYEILREHFSDRRGEFKSQDIGEFIKKYQRRIEAGLRFEDAGERRDRKLWKVEVSDLSTFNHEMTIFLNLS
ncbi:MAG TPA: hypothetical protein PK880_05810 [Candidatus Competibacter sp.]|nr:hypothetical protein [Candidatus Competibacteraceae bacterium]HRC72033.1 hypothetical protein [Candidatus Competibacter sp.]